MGTVKDTTMTPLFAVEAKPQPPKPFIKWIGGKTQLLKEIRKNYPQGLETGEISTYVEPFIGGGAVFFDVMSRFADTLEHTVINDINPNIVNAYRVIRDDSDTLIAELGAMRTAYVSLSPDSRAEFYYARRDEYNEVNRKELGQNSVSRAALLIYLNKTCFNGLYRVNRAGKFNAAHGRYADPAILNAENIKSVSAALESTDITWGSYENTAQWAHRDDAFVYLDPPYRPLTKTANFVSYDASVFSDKEQRDLGEFVETAHQSGAKILLSNSDPKNSDPDDNFFDELYAGKNISRVSARRMVSTKGDGRGAVNEILVSNY